MTTHLLDQSLKSRPVIPAIQYHHLSSTTCVVPHTHLQHPGKNSGEKIEPAAMVKSCHAVLLWWKSINICFRCPHFIYLFFATKFIYCVQHLFLSKSLPVYGNVLQVTRTAQHLSDKWQLWGSNVCVFIYRMLSLTP